MLKECTIINVLPDSHCQDNVHVKPLVVGQDYLSQVFDSGKFC